MIYTSYFAAMRKMTDEQKARCVSIARFTPKGVNVPKYKALFPLTGMLNALKEGSISEEYFTKYYLKQLYKLDVDNVFRGLNDKILCCYEKPGDFCHRHILTEWLRNHGYECEELIL